MRLRALGSVLVLSVSGCSLLVGTDGFSGDDTKPSTGADAADAATPPDDAGGSDASSEAAPPRDPTLVGEWRFDDVGAKVAADTSGSGHDARLTGSAAIVAGGVRGGALALNGNTDAAIVDTLSGASFPKSGTFSMWLRTSKLADSSNHGAFDDWQNGRSHLFVRRPNDGTPKEIQVAVQDDAPFSANPYYLLVTEYDLDLAVWSHVVITWSPTQASLYVDARQAATAKLARAFDPVGQRFLLGDDWVGQIDEVSLWSRELSALEVASLPGKP